MNIENSLKKLYKSAEEVKKSKELAEKLDESQLEKLKSHQQGLRMFFGPSRQFAKVFEAAVLYSHELNEKQKNTNP